VPGVALGGSNKGQGKLSVEAGVLWRLSDTNCLGGAFFGLSASYHL
jgi:hypothetical protein